MSDSELKRSLRRGVAVLLLPVSLLLVQVQLLARNLPGVVESSLPGLSRAFGIVLFAVASLYLVLSVLRQVSAAADTPF